MASRFNPQREISEDLGSPDSSQIIAITVRKNYDLPSVRDGPREVPAYRSNGAGKGVWEAVDPEYANKFFEEVSRTINPRKYNGHRTLVDKESNIAYVETVPGIFNPVKPIASAAKNGGNGGNGKDLSITRKQMQTLLGIYDIVTVNENGDKTNRLLTRGEVEAFGEYLKGLIPGSDDDFTYYVTPKGIQGIKKDIGENRAPNQDEMGALLDDIEARKSPRSDHILKI